MFLPKTGFVPAERFPLALNTETESRHILCDGFLF